MEEFIEIHVDFVAAAFAAALIFPRFDTPGSARRARGYVVPRAFAREFFATFSVMGVRD